MLGVGIPSFPVSARRLGFNPSILWPTGTEPGMWIDPSNLTSQWQDSTGTTPVATPGTVADSSNPVGLALDLRLGATALTDPGNHLLQATSTARPMESARVNLLTYTEDFGNAAWSKDGATVSGQTLSETATDTSHRIYYTAPMVAGSQYTYSAILKKGTGLYGFIYCSISPEPFRVNLETGAVIAGSGGTVIPRDDGSYVLSVTGVFSSYAIVQVGLCGAAGQGGYVGNPATNIQVLDIQLELGTTATPYQAILTDGSTYNATGFHIYQHFDGIDDGMATASFAAGTLTSSMDCLIAVRRDSAGNAVCGLYESVAEANKVFGIAESGSGSGCVGSGAGTPTVWVDGVQLTGGTAVTRGTLHTALTVGDYHVLEFRGLDLSTWTASGFGLYTSYVLNGAQGGILLFPSSTSTANRDAARTWLGAKVGLTL